MRENTISLQDFVDVIRKNLQKNLSKPYPSVNVEIQQIEKLMGESHLGIRLDKGLGRRPLLSTSSIIRK